MLRKLMKHEFRATGRIMLPMLLLVLLTAFGANLATRTLLELDNNVLNTLGVLLLTAFTLAIAAVCFVAIILMIQRFYKNLLQDEAYVMMTLPVSVHQHVISKLLVSMIWFVVTLAVVMAAFFILVYQVGMVKDGFNAVKNILSDVYIADLAPHMTGYVLELIALVFFSGAAYCLQFYMAMAIGHSFSNRKLLMSVLVYFGMQFILQAGSGVILGILDNTYIYDFLVETLAMFPSSIMVHCVMTALAVLSIIFAAVLYFPTVWFLNKRLNLE